MDNVIENSEWYQEYQWWEDRGAICQLGKNGRNSIFPGERTWLRHVRFRVPLKNSGDI